MHCHETGELSTGFAQLFIISIYVVTFHALKKYIHSSEIWTGNFRIQNYVVNKIKLVFMFRLTYLKVRRCDIIDNETILHQRTYEVTVSNYRSPNVFSLIPHSKRIFVYKYFFGLIFNLPILFACSEKTSLRQIVYQSLENNIWDPFVWCFLDFDFAIGLGTFRFQFSTEIGILVILLFSMKMQVKPIYSTPNASVKWKVI